MHAPASHTARRFAPTALMLGNFVTGCSVIGPAGMLGELSLGLDVSIRDAGLLITYGAAVLCFGSPVTAWLTSRIERRTLLVSTLAVFAVTNAASAFAPNYASLLVLRLLMLAVGALYTPQAAGTAGLIVREEKRGSGNSDRRCRAPKGGAMTKSAAVGTPTVGAERRREEP